MHPIDLRPAYFKVGAQPFTGGLGGRVCFIRMDSISAVLAALMA